MTSATFDSDKLSYEPLTADNLPENFDCGVKDLNEFLLEDAIAHADQKVATTTLVFLRQPAYCLFRTMWRRNPSKYSRKGTNSW